MAHVGAAEALRRLGRDPEAEVVLAQALSAAFDSPACVLALARLLFDSGRAAVAAGLLELAEQRGPDRKSIRVADDPTLALLQASCAPPRQPCPELYIP